MLDNFEYTKTQTGEIMVSAYQELIEADSHKNEVWGYCLRIENNSNERIRLLKKDLCITDNLGNSSCSLAYGFNGELPDLEPGECFEFEDTASFCGTAAVLYGFCSAINTKGKELKIKLPVINLSSENVATVLSVQH